MSPCFRAPDLIRGLHVTVGMRPRVKPGARQNKQKAGAL